MNQLSVINILQEYAVQNGMVLPKYEFENITRPSEPSKFICICTFNNTTVKETDGSKKGAKHKAAQSMMDTIKSPNFTLQKPQIYSNDVPLAPATLKSCPSPIKSETSSSVVSTENSVSILNEYCSKNRYDYPAYNGMGFKDGEFIIQCVHQSVFTEGVAPTKKQAKQNAAAKMLDIIWKHQSPDVEPKPENNEMKPVGYKSPSGIKAEAKPSTPQKYSEEEVIAKGIALSIDNLINAHSGKLSDFEIKKNSNPIADALENLSQFLDEKPPTKPDHTQPALTQPTSHPVKVEQAEIQSPVDIKKNDSNVANVENLSQCYNDELAIESTSHYPIKLERTEMLKQQLTKLGISFNIKSLSDDPIVLLMTINSGSLKGGNHYIESGNDYEEVLINLLQQTLEGI